MRCSRQKYWSGLPFPPTIVYYKNVYTKVPTFLFTCFFKHFIVFIASETPILYLWHFLTSYCWYEGKLFNYFILLLYLFSEANMSANNLAFQPFCKKKLLLTGESLLSIQHFKCILSLSLYLHTHTHIPMHTHTISVFHTFASNTGWYGRAPMWFLSKSLASLPVCLTSGHWRA